MKTIKRLIKSIYYYFFEIKGTIFFKLKYFLEKSLQFLITTLNVYFQKPIKYPFLFHQDYIIENKLGKFFIRKHSDYDYPIQPYVEDGHDHYMDIGSKKIFLDIGGHVGLYAIKFINHNKNKKIHVYCFEPHPQTYEDLCKNIQLNNLAEIVTPINKGIYSQKGSVHFTNSCPKDASISKIVKDKSENTIEIETLPIDNFISDYKINPSDVGFIKIDVEGLEFEVFKGMKSFLSEAREIKIVCEILDEAQQKIIFPYLKDLGFKIEGIDDFNFLFIK